MSAGTDDTENRRDAYGGFRPVRWVHASTRDGAKCITGRPVTPVAQSWGTTR